MFSSREAIAVYRGWQDLEDRNAEEARVVDPDAEALHIIDFDLVPEIQDREHFDTRAQVRRRLLELRSGVEVTDETTEFIRAKFHASAYYLQLLERDVQAVEFYDHVRNMLGITPELISEEVVAEQERKVFALLSEGGVAFRNGRPQQADLARFEDQIRVFKDQAEQELAANEALLPVVQEILDLTGLEVPYHVQLADVDEYWKGWASGKKGDFLLRLNFNARHRWRKGDMEYFFLHEVCGHFLQAAALNREIAAGRLDPFIGITTEHDPHGFLGEAVADALTYFFPERIPLSEYGVLSREQRIFNDYLSNNAHLRINMGEPPWQLLGYLLRNPFTPAEAAKSDLEEWRTHPLWRSYQYSYGIAMKYHQRFAARMTYEQKVRYLRYAFTRYLTPRRLLGYAERLLEE